MKFKGTKGRPVAERFWEKVNIGKPDECWNWIASVGSAGRGVFGVRGKHYVAPRMAWILTNGEIPEGMFICHTCDNGLCCNPNHLYVGTPSDNAKDREERGRGNRRIGQDDPKSKLTDDQVRFIKEHYKPFDKVYSQFGLARMMGVSRSTIENIVHGICWKHVA